MSGKIIVSFFHGPVMSSEIILTFFLVLILIYSRTADSFTCLLTLDHNIYYYTNLHTSHIQPFNRTEFGLCLIRARFIPLATAGTQYSDVTSPYVSSQYDTSLYVYVISWRFYIPVHFIPE
jgi:hypothetical protein